MPGYTTLPADVERDRERILALWRTGLTHYGMPEAKFDWYYRRNPEGLPRVLFLCEDDTGEAVGCASMGPRRMRHGATTLSAGALADFVVAREHRNFFPALALQRAMTRHGLAHHALLFGMPNVHSEAVVLRAGSRRVGEIVRRARVLRSGAYFARYVPRWVGGPLGLLVDAVRLALMRLRGAGPFAAQWIDRPDDRFDELWRRAAPADLVVGERDARFLAWRFADCPLQPHRFLALSSAGSLVAYAVCKTDASTLTVCDFLVDAAHAGAARRLWDEVALEAWRRGHASTSVEFLGPPAVHRQIEEAGWVERSRRTFCAAVGGRDELLAPERWYVTQADEDG